MLVGGGHSHIEVLRQAAKGRYPGVDIVLVSPDPVMHYSGMVPGYLRGSYDAGDLAIPLAPLAQSAGARFIAAAADRVDARNRIVSAGPYALDFDVVSLDVGAAAAGLDETPGARLHAHSLRPMANAMTLRTRFDELLDAVARSSPGLEICVVGGGAAGTEVALALHGRAAARGVHCTVHLVDQGAVILPGLSARSRAAATRTLRSRGVQLHLGAAVDSVGTESVTLANGVTLRALLTVWAAGSAPPPLLAASDIARDGSGYLLVDRRLQAIDGSHVWGAGDCIAVQGHPRMPKGGVYAMRAAPVLAANLAAALIGGPPRDYRPRAEALWLLNTADGRAILDWRRLSLHGRWAWWLKHAIDSRFVKRYQVAAGQ